MRLRKVCPQCNTVVHVKRSVCNCGHAFTSKKMKAPCSALGEPENAMKCRKVLLSEEELLVTKQRDKVHKASKRASETREQTLHRQEQNRTHLACVEGSALQCCSLALFPALCNVCRLAVQNSHRILCCKQEQAGEVSLEVAPTISPSLWPRPDPQWKESGKYKLKSLGLQKKSGLIPWPSASPSMYRTEGQRRVAKGL